MPPLSMSPSRASPPLLLRSALKGSPSWLDENSENVDHSIIFENRDHNVPQHALLTSKHATPFGELELPLLDLTAVQCNTCMLSTETASLFEDMSDMATSAYQDKVSSSSTSPTKDQIRDKYSVEDDAAIYDLPLRRTTRRLAENDDDDENSLAAADLNPLKARFAPKLIRKCVYVLHRRDFTPAEKAATWYTLEDYERFRTARRVAVERMERDHRHHASLKNASGFYGSIHARKHKPYSVRDRSCTRGLENKTRDGARRRHACIAESVAAVLEEQDYQQLTRDRVDDVRLSRVYMNYTLSSQVLARQQALLDARDALAIRAADGDDEADPASEDVDDSLRGSCGSSVILPYPSMPFMEIVSL